jgi:hypothetical protein
MQIGLSLGAIQQTTHGGWSFERIAVLVGFIAGVATLLDFFGFRDWLVSKLRGRPRPQVSVGGVGRVLELIAGVALIAVAAFVHGTVGVGLLIAILTIILVLGTSRVVKGVKLMRAHKPAVAEDSPKRSREEANSSVPRPMIEAPSAHGGTHVPSAIVRAPTSQLARAASMGPPTIGRLLITAVEILEDARAANRLDRRRARYDPAYKLGHVIGKAASAARIGPPPKLARWLQDVAERVEEYHPEYADEIVQSWPGGSGTLAEIETAVEQNTAVLQRIQRDQAERQP